MSRWLFPNSAFTPVAKEAPAIPNLSFATFLGNKTLNPKDGTNLAPGGASFITGGQGPQYAANYATFTVGNCLITTMPDLNVGGAYPHTIVFVASPTALNQFSTYMSFTSVGFTDTRLDSLPINSLAVNIRSQAGIIVNGAGATDCPFASNDQTTWNMFAWVCVTGKPLMLYNLTSGVAVQSIQSTIANARPSAGQWNIGCLTSTYVNPSRMAFALGANTEMSQSDLMALRDAIRFPLQARGILI